MLTTFDQFLNLPEELINVIIFYSENKVYDLCLVDKYFSHNSKKIMILSNKKYPELSDEHLKGLVNLVSLNLRYNNIKITNEGIEHLNNILCLKINENVNIINDSSIKTLTNLTSLNIDYNHTITDKGIKNLHKLKHLAIAGTMDSDSSAKVAASSDKSATAAPHSTS